MAWNHKHHQIEALQADNAALAQQVGELEAEVSLERVVDAVSASAREAIAQPEFQSLVGEEAIALAGVEVVAKERQRLTGELTDSLKLEKYDELVAEFRQTEGAGIVDSLRALFAKDGTFDDVKTQAEAYVRAELQEDVLAELHAEADEELSDPSERTRIEQQLRAELAASVEMKDYREGLRASNEERWTQEVHDQVIADIDAEEAAREPEFKAAYADKVRSSSSVEKHRQKTRAGLEAQWTKASELEVLAQIDDEELRALVEERDRILKEQISNELATKAVLADFVSSGVDVTQVAPETRLEIYLGELATFNIETKVKDRYGDWKKATVPTPGVSCRRKLTLTSLGEGKYIVDGDSLLEVDDVYAANDALHRGTIITIGRKVKDGANHRLEQKITAGVPLYYCDDTETGALTDSLLPVANVVVNGVSAKDVQHIEMV